MKRLSFFVLIGSMFLGSSLYACTEFGNKIKDCSTYFCKFKHPFTGNEMTKSILGIKDGKCQITEEMPNNGKMTCDFPKDKLAGLAKFYSSNGKENASYLNEAMNDGTCKITGY